MRRRSLLATTAALAATSGCLDVLTGEEPLERAASPARVPESARSETGYELADASSEELDREVTVAGQTRQVRAVNELVEYHRTVDLGPLGERKLAVFATVATPAFEIAGQVMSPVEEWSNRKLALQVQNQYDGLEVGEATGSRTVETLDTTMELSQFAGAATVADGTSVDVNLHVGTVRHDADFVLPVGVYPQRLSGEAETIAELVGVLAH